MPNSLEMFDLAVLKQHHTRRLPIELVDHILSLLVDMLLHCSPKFSLIDIMPFCMILRNARFLTRMHPSRLTWAEYFRETDDKLKREVLNDRNTLQMYQARKLIPSHYFTSLFL